MPLSRAVWATALILGATLRLAGQAPAVNSTPVNLPEFNVVGERELPPPETWYYTKVAGQEVLSSASRTHTEQMARDLTRLLHALDLTGTTLLPKQKIPLRIVISGQADQFLKLAPQALEFGETDPETAALGGPENPILVINSAARSLDEAAADDDVNAEPGSAEARTPEMRAAAVIRNLRVNYFRTVLGQQRPPLPAWFIEGLSQVLTWVRITENSVTLGFIENPNKTGPIGGNDSEPGHSKLGDLRHVQTLTRDSLSSDLDFNAALATTALFTMQELFTSDLHSFRDKENALKGLRWQKQCHAFVNWGLFGDYGRHEKEFLAFMKRLQSEPLSEKLFKECFGLDYAGGLAALRTHIEVTRVKVVGVKAGKDEKLPPEPAVEVREATPLEVARLKSIVYTAGGQPEKAREELILAYRRGERSPDLVAELGLAELAAGKRDRAAKYLMIAAKAKTTRLRAYLALAQMRLDERTAKPQGKDGRLSYEQLLGVLEPLLLARTQAPRSPEVYQLFAEAWARTDTPPPPQHLALVDEGLRLFPEHTGLRATRERLGPTATAK